MEQKKQDCDGAIRMIDNFMKGMIDYEFPKMATGANIVGDLGELLVLRELRDRLKKIPNAKVDYFGGLSKIDVVVTSQRGTKLNVEVRTSSLRTGRTYGWNLIKDEKCTMDNWYLVLVKLNEDFKGYEFYTLSHEQAKHFGKKSLRFNSVDKSRVLNEKDLTQLTQFKGLEVLEKLAKTS